MSKTGDNRTTDADYISLVASLLTEIAGIRNDINRVLAQASGNGYIKSAIRAAANNPHPKTAAQRHAVAEQLDLIKYIQELEGKP